jgi:hypothetical protein
VRRMVVLALIALTVIALLPQAAAAARLCSRTATLRDTPRGFVVARLYAPQTLNVVRRAAGGRWTRVRARNGVTGWITTRSLCRG